MENRYIHIDKAYDFLVERENLDDTFNIKELSYYSGLSESTCKTYLSKKWYQYIEKSNFEYIVKTLKTISKEQFRSISSQKNSFDINRVEYGKLLNKAREFALLAVSIYNNPFTEFKTYGFIVNIIIAYTSLFHAIFERRNEVYYYKGKNGDFKIIDGQEKAWELSTCLDKYWINSNKPEKSNLDFLIKLRNKIEHRGLPAIDIMVAGECQAALNNFELLLVREFGEKYALGTNLAIAMQLNNISSQAQIKARKEFQTQAYQDIKKFMDSYRGSLNEDIINSQNYRISVYLIPKISNNINSSDLSIEFIHVDYLSDEQKKNYEHAISFLKQVEFPYKFKPSRVVELIKEKIPTFNIHKHTECWKKYNARPNSIDTKFKGEYSAYIEGYDSYLYSKKWVDFLIGELSK